MDSQALKDLQAPLKQQYRDRPESAMVTLRAAGRLGEGLTCKLDTGRAMMKRLGINVQLRIFRATFAGPNTGTIVVTQEYPSWAALSESQAKTAADPEFSAWLKNLDSVRTITSDSLFREL